MLFKEGEINDSSRTPMRLVASENERDEERESEAVDVFEEIVEMASRELKHISITQILRPIVEALDAVCLFLFIT